MPAPALPAPFQLRDGVTVAIDGTRYEVRRTRFVWSLGPMSAMILPDGTLREEPALRHGEFPDGAPAVAVDGVPFGPGMFEIARRAIFEACGFADAVSAQASGMDLERGDRPSKTSAIYYPLQTCPAQDGPNPL